MKLILFPHLQFYRFLITAGRNVSKKVYGQLRDHKITPALQDGATPSPAGRQRAVSSSHTSMLTTARKPPSEHSLWIGVTFDWLSAARCVSIKDDVLYGSWSEWRTCSYKHALQFSPRCEAERLSNQPSEGTSQNEWESRPTLHDGHLQNLVSVIGFVLFLLPSHPPNFLISRYFFCHTSKITVFFFSPSYLSTHKSGTLLCIDRKLTFTVAVIYMVMKGSVSRFISSFSVSSLQRRGSGETPPAYQDKAIWMDNTFSSTYKGLSWKEQAHLLQQSHSSR